MSIPELCKRTTKDQKIVVSENISKMLFVNEQLAKVTLVKVDGCAITHGIRCDFLLIDASGKEYYVELKGSDVDHAVQQIERTIDILSADKKRKEKCSFIISTRCPMLTTKIQELKVKFKNKYNSTLIIKNKIHQHII